METSTPVVIGRKRAREEGDDFIPGNIMRIELENFMTYSNLDVVPGPRLNLVLGPNGTGKSSIVCALCLGTAGDPKTLGRASHLGDYVMRGEDWGSVKLTIKGKEPGRNISIFCKLLKNNKTEWQIDGRKATKENVRDLVKEYNIQTGNLCQFLPQDRVCEFAKMSPVELLTATEEAAEDNSLHQMHQKLIELRKGLRGLETTVQQHEVSLEQLKADNEELERDKNKLERRNELMEQAALHEKKMPWLKFDRQQNIFGEVKRRKKAAEAAANEKTKELQLLEGPVNAKKEMKAAAEDRKKQANKAYSADDEKRKRAVDNLQKLEGEMNEKRKEIEVLQRQEAGRMQKLQKAEQEVAEAQNELDNLPPYTPPTEELRALAGPIRDLDMRIRDKGRERQEVADSKVAEHRQLEWCNKKLNDLNSVKHHRLQALAQGGARQIQQAYEWVSQHKSQLRGEVYGPVLLEMTVREELHACFLEQHTPKWLFRAFITTCREDSDFLVRELKRFGVPVINYGGNADGPIAGKWPITDQMRSLGIHSTLDELFDAPQVVKHVLCDHASLHHSYVGDEYSEAHVEAIINARMGVQDLWTPNSHFRVTRSKYADATSTMAMQVHPCRLFRQGADMAELEGLQAEKQALSAALAAKEQAASSLSAEVRALENELADLNRKREALQRKANDYRLNKGRLESKLSQRKKKLETLQNSESVAEQEARLEQEIRARGQKRFKEATLLKGIILLLGEALETYQLAALSAAELDQKVHEAEESLHEVQQERLRLARELEAAKAEYLQEREKTRKAKEEATSVVELTPEIQEQFYQMPDTVEELQEAMDGLKAEAARILCSNPNALADYENRCQQIEELEEKLVDERERLETGNGKIDRLKSQWLPRLREVVAKISHTFGNNFAQMAIAGEVCLDEHGMDFENYGIHIKVQFRENSELKVLSAQHQSGGERSVSTILYLISMQDLTTCPFRVVDEINQGMDPINERKMFQQLVRSASQPNTPQCFLLTPKLLPNLDYGTDACTVLNIMNGPWITEAAKRWKPDQSFVINIGAATAAVH